MQNSLAVRRVTKKARTPVATHLRLLLEVSLGGLEFRA